MTNQQSGRLSIIPAAAVSDERLCRTDLAVLCALAAFANRQGRCWPATTSLASDLGISTRQIRRCLRNLETCRYVNTKNREGQPSIYVIAREVTDPGHPSSGVEHDPGHGGSGGADTQVPGTPDTQVPPKDSKKDPLNDYAFDGFWRIYPSRRPHSNPKKPARQKFEAALKRGVSASVILRGTENYAVYVARETTDPRYIPQAKTWLHQECWTDYQEPLGEVRPEVAPL